MAEAARGAGAAEVVEAEVARGKVAGVEVVEVRSSSWRGVGGRSGGEQKWQQGGEARGDLPLLPAVHMG